MAIPSTSTETAPVGVEQSVMRCMLMPNRRCFKEELHCCTLVRGAKKSSMHSIFATLNLISAMEAAIHSARGAVGEQSEKCQKIANLKIC